MGDFLGFGDSDKSSSSSSTSSNTTNTTNIDRRQVMSDGAIGITSDSSTVNVEQVDAGLVKAALDVVAGADATAGDGFNRLLSLTEKIFSTGGQVLDKTASASLAAVSAVDSARAEAAGTIDQKTLVILGAVGLGAAYLFKKKG